MIRRDHLVLLVRWIVLGALIGVLCGAASALFLVLLEHATAFRVAHEPIVYALPVAGLVIGWFYQRHGRSIRAGNNLVIDTLRDDGAQVPRRMAPMVLVGTVLTHLFGGSAGREGTAVQMGASLADWCSHRLSVPPSLRRQLLAAGVAGGFGSVFGTPLAGAVFALEFVVLRRITYGAIVPALTASLVGDATTRALGVGHMHSPVLAPLDVSWLLVGQWIVFAAAVAAVTVTFIELTEWLKRHAERLVPSLPWRMAAGGAIIVLMWTSLGTSDYLGLGLPTIARAFEDPSLPPWAFAAKLLFTAVTLAAGFLGGEVTPLFFVGAALGNVLAPLLGLPLEMCAGVGLAATFAAASNTPLALSIMAVELFGAHVLPHAAIVAVLAYLFTGRRSIYPAQRPADG